jgi:WD40 repeat protein
MSTSNQSSSSRTVRVFLSSTFRDFAEERDLLVRKIFPELRRKCRERQVELVDVDLRWGITEEEAKQGKVLPICLAEIDRSRPYFMGFIGERYGWTPEPHQYDLPLLMEQPWLEEHRGGKSVTELEMLHGVLNNSEMKNRAFFYFRDAKYSEAKGGPYLSEGPADKTKLEELKERIRSSGFPVVENYPDPEALAERVRDDLWKLIDEAYPANEIPDPLTLERRRHEAYAASRRRLYLGGEHYFRALDDAMEGDPSKADFKPVLITGASGGGKSALLANWAARWSGSHPDTEVILHHLGCGADAADPVKLAVRLMQEIARITGEDFQPESDPEKQLGKLPEWLAKGSAWAERTGKGILLVLDGLDKVSDRTHLRWFPSLLPPGIRMVASCLDGEILQAAKDRLPWSELRVEPLTDEGKRTLIIKYLHELYRKSLTSDQIDRIIAHPLSGNPLFLKALLEELRIFGVFELLEARLEDYLSATTIDGLFAKVFARVEEDNSPEDVRAVMEILWGSLESFAEDELVGEHSVTGLAPAKWAPILIALDESLVSEHGRIALGHDYFRKAVEDRYLPTEEDKRRVLKKLSEFCAGAMESEGRKGNSPYVRRQAVRHFLLAEDWDRAADALSDLDYVEAWVRNSELLPLLMDYSLAEKSLPEGEAEKKLEEERQAELDRYARAMVEYAATWTRIREGSGEAEPTLPRPVPSVRMWTEEQIEAERIRRTEQPNRLDRVRAFKLFVATNATPLEEYSRQEGFVANHARNDAPAGPVHEEGERKLKDYDGIKLIKRFHPEERYNPIPACIAVLEGHRRGVFAVSFAFDGNRVVSGSWDKSLRIWEAESGECIRVLTGHENLVTSVALSPDGRKIVSGSNDNTVRIWDGESGECLRVLTGHENWVTSVALSPDGNRVVSGCGDKSLRIWDAESGECLQVLTGHENMVNSVVVSPDGRRIVSGSSDTTLRIWDIESGECLRLLKGQNPVIAVSVTSDGKRIISGSGGSNMLRIWDMESGKCLHLLEGHEDLVTSLATTPEGRIIISGSQDQSLRIWELESGKCLRVIKGHEGWINAVSVTLDGSRVVSGSSDTTLRIWDIKSGECLPVPEAHKGKATTVSVTSAGSRAISGGRDTAIRIWDIKSRKCLHVLKGNRLWVESIATTPDGSRVISVTPLQILDIESG